MTLYVVFDAEPDALILQGLTDQKLEKTVSETCEELRGVSVVVRVYD